MFPTLRASSAHRPLIHFIGKRIWPSSATVSHPHPAAPPEFQKAFSSAGTPSSQTSSSSSKEIFQDFWEAPTRFWSPRHKQLEEVEIDAILVRLPLPLIQLLLLIP
ncbi:hypothetical protein BJ138DRAFT_1004366 [Hygrophoropsis aurantiaca]|uniref:Uncharacterized protein n=1 Tax=Hygrophoropsis aurantiaca TaxID=72124 RepID=A0ACB8AGU6_9AGAM|nr:hypothetical protein BJ138DRAFT_1004366 [Hygrophoropsis aurantiaca]